MALVYERTRRPHERYDRLELRRLSGRPGDRGEVVSRTVLRLPHRIPLRVRRTLERQLAEGMSE